MAGWIIDTITATGYWGILLLMCVENVFPPIPSEFIMPLAGYLAVQGQYTLAGIIIAGTVGTLLGTLPLYYLGSRLGKEGLIRFAERHGRWLALSPEDIEHADTWFDKHGGKAVLLGRLVPGLRSLISIPAGINGMGMGKYLLYSTVGTVAWVSLLAYAGYLLGSNFREIDKYLDIVVYAVIGIMVVLYVRRVITFRKKGKHKKK